MTVKCSARYGSTLAQVADVEVMPWTSTITGPLPAERIEHAVAVQDDLVQIMVHARLWLLARRHGDLRGCQQPTPGSIGAFRRRASVVVPDDLVAGQIGVVRCRSAGP